MSYKEALADLKEQYGARKMLNTDEVAEAIGKSREALAMLRYRRRFPIGKKVGARFMVSIYDLAHFIGDPPEPEEATSAGQAKLTPRPRASAIDRLKPTRKPPSLARSLMAFRKSIDDIQSQVEFQNEIFARLEAIVIANSYASTSR